MRLRLLRSLVLMLFACAPVAANAETMTWYIKKNYSGPAQVVFYSQTRTGWTWPNSASGGAYNLNSSRIETIEITCEAGEKICYGAWVAGKGSLHWGAGMGGAGGCQHCCGTCGAKMNVSLDDSADGPSASSTTLSSPTNKAVTAFRWVYNFQPSPGVRSWSLDDTNKWHERYPDGSEAKVFDRVTRGSANSCPGAVVSSSREPDFEVFIPDVGCNRMWALFRHGTGPWSGMGEMLAIR